MFNITDLNLSYQGVTKVSLPCVEGLSNTGTTLLLIANVLLFSISYLYFTQKYKETTNKGIYFLKLSSFIMVALNLVLIYYWAIL